MKPLQRGAVCAAHHTNLSAQPSSRSPRSNDTTGSIIICMALARAGLILGSCSSFKTEEQRRLSHYGIGYQLCMSGPRMRPLRKRGMDPSDPASLPNYKEHMVALQIKVQGCVNILPKTARQDEPLQSSNL